MKIPNLERENETEFRITETPVDTIMLTLGNTKEKVTDVCFFYNKKNVIRNHHLIYSTVSISLFFLVTPNTYYYYYLQAAPLLLIYSEYYTTTFPNYQVLFITSNDPKNKTTPIIVSRTNMMIEYFSC